MAVGNSRSGSRSRKGSKGSRSAMRSSSKFRTSSQDGAQGGSIDGDTPESPNVKHRFEILKKLGSGTYGKVSLAFDHKTERDVAIKLIKKSAISNKQDLIRIKREIRIMSALKHPNLIQIYEVFENREKIIIVMEYASCGELYDHVSQKGCLSESEARKVFREITSAVLYCHKNHVAHRDLKLENILIDKTKHAKIADFGLSNYFQPDLLLHTFCGSPLYASPEIINGTPYKGPEVDCWSLGVLLYTLVYGSMPFDGRDFNRMIRQIKRGAYYEPDTPSTASMLIRNMLRVNPDRRANIEDIASHWWLNLDENLAPILELPENQVIDPIPLVDRKETVVVQDLADETDVFMEFSHLSESTRKKIEEFRRRRKEAEKYIDESPVYKKGKPTKTQYALADVDSWEPTSGSTVEKNKDKNKDKVKDKDNDDQNISTDYSLGDTSGPMERLKALEERLNAYASKNEQEPQEKAKEGMEAVSTKSPRRSHSPEPFSRTGDNRPLMFDKSKEKSPTLVPMETEKSRSHSPKMTEEKVEFPLSKPAFHGLEKDPDAQKKAEMDTMNIWINQLVEESAKGLISPGLISRIKRHPRYSTTPFVKELIESILGVNETDSRDVDVIKTEMDNKENEKRKKANSESKASTKSIETDKSTKHVEIKEVKIEDYPKKKESETKEEPMEVDKLSVQEPRRERTPLIDIPVEYSESYEEPSVVNVISVMEPEPPKNVIEVTELESLEQKTQVQNVKKPQVLTTATNGDDFSRKAEAKIAIRLIARPSQDEEEEDEEEEEEEEEEEDEDESYNSDFDDLDEDLELEDELEDEEGTEDAEAKKMSITEEPDSDNESFVSATSKDGSEAVSEPPPDPSASAPGTFDRGLTKRLSLCKYDPAYVQKGRHISIEDPPEVKRRIGGPQPEPKDAPILFNKAKQYIVHHPDSPRDGFVMPSITPVTPAYLRRMNWLRTYDPDMGSSHERSPTPAAALINGHEASSSEHQKTEVEPKGGIISDGLSDAETPHASVYQARESQSGIMSNGLSDVETPHTSVYLAKPDLDETEPDMTFNLVLQPPPRGKKSPSASAPGTPTETSIPIQHYEKTPSPRPSPNFVNTAVMESPTKNPSPLDRAPTPPQVFTFNRSEVKSPSPRPGDTSRERSLDGSPPAYDSNLRNRTSLKDKRRRNKTTGVSPEQLLFTRAAAMLQKPDDIDEEEDLASVLSPRNFRHSQSPEHDEDRKELPRRPSYRTAIAESATPASSILKDSGIHSTTPYEGSSHSNTGDISGPLSPITSGAGLDPFYSHHLHSTGAKRSLLDYVRPRLHDESYRSPIGELGPKLNEPLGRIISEERRKSRSLHELSPDEDLSRDAPPIPPRTYLYSDRYKRHGSDHDLHKITPTERSPEPESPHRPYLNNPTYGAPTTNFTTAYHPTYQRDWYRPYTGAGNYRSKYDMNNVSYRRGTYDVEPEEEKKTDRDSSKESRPLFTRQRSTSLEKALAKQSSTEQEDLELNRRSSDDYKRPGDYNYISYYDTSGVYRPRFAPDHDRHQPSKGILKKSSVSPEKEVPSHHYQSRVDRASSPPSYHHYQTRAERAISPPYQYHTRAERASSPLSRFRPSRFMEKLRRHLSNEKIDKDEEPKTNRYSHGYSNGYNSTDKDSSDLKDSTAGDKGRKKRSILDMARRRTTEIHYNPRTTPTSGTKFESTRTRSNDRDSSDRDSRRPSSPLEKIKGFFKKSKENLTSAVGTKGTSTSYKPSTATTYMPSVALTGASRHRKPYSSSYRNHKYTPATTTRYWYEGGDSLY